jgi:hypothetical protein
MLMAIGELERRFLLECVMRGSDRDGEIRELAMCPLDWNSLFMSALWQKIAFLVYSRMKATSAIDIALARGNLPLLLLNHWKQLAKVNEVRSRLYADVAVELCEAASSVGVDLVVSKGGIAMFGSVYSHFERKTYDVDFIARRHDVGALGELFASCGFRHGEYAHATESLGPARSGDVRKHLLQGRGLPNFVRPVSDGPIDYLVAQVRFRIGAGYAGGRSVSADALMERAVNRDGIRVVNWADLSLQLALHVHREAHEDDYARWNLGWNLVKLCDFDRALHRGREELADELVARAAELGFLAEVAFAARATAIFFPSPLLDDVALRCSRGDPPALDADELHTKLWSTGTGLGRQEGVWVDLAGPKTT